MNRYFQHCLALAIFSTSFAVVARAQAPAQASAQPPAATIKLLVVLSRYEGDKKLSSLPYTLSLVPGQNGSIRAGAEIPVPTTVMGADKGTTSYSMQSVGSQVDATVNPTPDGKFKLTLTVTDRSVVTAQTTMASVGNVPSFRNMMSNSQAILSNGETIQFTSSSDRATNETFRIDVTLTVGNK
jgi:hypothetical protein